MFVQPEADRLVQAATAELAWGRTSRAAKLLDDAIRIDPQHNMAQTRQAEVAMRTKDHARALALTRTVLAMEPNFAPAWNQYASACWSTGQHARAVDAARRAVDIQPPNPEFRLRLAQFTAWTGLGQETREALAPLLAAEHHDKPHYAAAIGMLGELAVAEGRFTEANAFLDQALALHPALDVTRMQRGMNRLRLGAFRTGWPDYAAREVIPELYPDGPPNFAGQIWQGQALPGKTLLVLDDQGHGDAIQFFRYLPMLRDRGAKHITWRTFPPLVRLLGDAAPYATVVNALPTGTRFDFQCNSTSLPGRFETELGSVPAEIPYLWPPSHLESAMKLPALRRGPPADRAQETRLKAGRPNVGLAWSGDTRHTRDHLRSIPADLFLALADLPGFRFHSLQHQVRPADLPALEARPTIVREVEKAVDLADTAALIARLDLVITVDTAVAHLAAAMGKPAWVLVHVAPDWRWLTERTNSPWYPTARLFRVTAPEWLGQQRAAAGDPIRPAGWGPILARVSQALQAFAAV